jgi:hypothetical protein
MSIEFEKKWKKWKFWNLDQFATDAWGTFFAKKVFGYEK